MERKKKFTVMEYELAIRHHGFRTITAFCEHYKLNNSTIGKIINGNNTFCSKEYLDNFHALISEELELVSSLQSKSISSSDRDQVVPA